MDYAMPRGRHLPDLLQYAGRQRAATTNPLGAKGVGESGTVGSTPTVMNAIMDALWPLGVRNLQMPATPHRVWRTIQDAKR